MLSVVHSIASAKVPVALVIDRETRDAGNLSAWCVIALHKDGSIHQQYDMPSYTAALEEAEPFITRNSQIQWLVDRRIAADASACNLFHHFGATVYFSIKPDIPKKFYMDASNRQLMRYRGCDNAEKASFMVDQLNATLSARWDSALKREPEIMISAADATPSTSPARKAQLLLLDHYRNAPLPRR